MCELFGFSGKNPQKINHELREFFSHSSQHPNGWGLCVLDGPSKSLERQAQSAYESAYLAERLRADVVTTATLAHIRRSTIGSDKYSNCHPFVGVDATGRTWTLAHNGTIFDESLLARYSAVQAGTTDSERILLHLLALVNAATSEKGASLTPEERFAVVDKMVLGFGSQNKVNLLIFDGELLYAHCNQEGTLHLCQSKNSVTISTQPLAVGSWSEAPFLQLVAYRQGQLAFQGTRHNNQYFLDQQRLDQVLAAYRYL